jgi:O-antigen biosynthesis protein
MELNIKSTKRVKAVSKYTKQKKNMLLIYYRIRDRYFPWVRHVKPAVKAAVKIPAIVNKMTIHKSVYHIKQHGLRNFLDVAKEHVFFDALYQKWLKKNVLSYEEAQMQRDTKFLLEPQISIIVPVYNTRKEHLTSMIESVKSQTYPHWELCITDGHSKEAHIKDILSEYSLNDKRIKIRFLDQNEGIAGNSNKAIALSSGSYITFLDHDDVLPQQALFEVVRTINENPEADFIYSDEDKITEHGTKRCDPHFKPEWSPDTLRSYNYITHLTVITKRLLDEIGWFRMGYDGSQDYDLILRATECAQRIVHISKILYHWRIIEGSTSAGSSEKPYTHISGRRALEDHLNRLKKEGKVEDGIFPNSYRLRYRLNSLPLVSIIIPNRDNAGELSVCIKSIIDGSTYKNYEIIIMENGSVEKQTFDLYRKLENVENISIYTWDKTFNYSQINNDAVDFAKGEIVLFLNNDMKVISPGWIESMLQHAKCERVGCVGAKLYYENNTIQHAGIVVGLCGIAGHPFKRFSRGSHGHKGRLNVIQNVSAVTGACLMMRKSVFYEVGGFDERYPLAFNDVDLCMNVRKLGYLIIYTPYSELYHCESKTRGFEDTTEKLRRFEMESQLFRGKWSSELQKGDPYYNRNLTLSREDYTPDV